MNLELAELIAANTAEDKPKAKARSSLRTRTKMLRTWTARRNVPGQN
ncbi:MAG: hypothetical protein R3A10_06760 [Caldilineaceae bacterium]